MAGQRDRTRHLDRGSLGRARTRAVVRATTHGDAVRRIRMVTPRLRLLAAELAALLLICTALTPLFVGGRWMLSATVAVLATALVAELARRAGVLRVLVPLVAVVALIVELV